MANQEYPKMFQVTDLESLTDELKCNHCNKLLSVLPVYFCSAIGNVCGRCTASLDWMIANGTLERATAYEAVAKYLIFPCCNKQNGCNEKLKYNQVEEHEKSCTIRDFLCPFDESVGCTTKCNWKGNIHNLVTHLQVDHKNNMQTNQQIMNVEEDNLQIFLSLVAEQMFVILTKFVKESNKFYCTVLCINKIPENQYYRFQLEIGRYEDYILTLRKNNTEQFCNITECISNYNKMIIVDVASVRTMLDNLDGLIYCRVSITKKSKKEMRTILEQFNTPEESAGVEPNILKFTENTFPSTDIADSAKSIPNADTKNLEPECSKTKTKRKKVKTNPNSSTTQTSTSKTVKQLSEMDKAFLEDLECPVCNCYMIPPIYICPVGHSICKECKFQMQHCPSCRVPLGTTRNYTLEKFAAKVSYPCKYVDYGCSEILNLEDISMHQENCNFSYNRCPLKLLTTCNAKNDLTDVIDHIKKVHVSCLIEENQMLTRNLKAKITSSYYATIHENQVFIVCCKHSATIGPVKFNVLHVGMKHGQAKYRFELEFLDQTDKGLKLIISKLCEPLSNCPSNALKNCLAVPLEMLEPFIDNKDTPNLFFKFLIHKICH